ncbi:MAG: hypothetical protein ACLPIX_09185 [Rhodomicrobium sp.]
MPETEKRDEREEQLNASSDLHAPGVSPEEAGAEPAQSPPSGGETEAASADSEPSDAGHSSEMTAEAAEHTDDAGLGEFADNVVSGLEQAGLAAEEAEALDLRPDDGGLDPTEASFTGASEAFFAGWGSLDSPEQGGTLVTRVARAPSLQTLSELGSASWGASEGVETGEGAGELNEVQAADSNSLSEAELTSWAGLGFPESEGTERREPHPQIPRTLSEMSLASASGLAGYGSDSRDDAAKHDELADAVQSALLSVYGGPPAQPVQPAATVFQKPPFAEEAGPSIFSRNPGAGSGFASPPGDGLSPQDVIFNYFDYTPDAPQGSGPQAGFPPDADDNLSPQEVILNYFDLPNGSAGPAPRSVSGAPNAYDSEAPISFRQRPETAAPQSKGWAAEDFSAQRPDWQAPSPQPVQYNGPPSFPVPAAANAAQKTAAPPSGQESSRLLGAAAVGLMGGIAIAASLAAFLIYGNPASVKIPGVGNLRIDRDEHGYGRTAPEESARELPKSTASSPAAEFASEVTAAGVVATPGQQTPLSINIRSPLPLERTLVSITGIPEGGRLNAGVFDTGAGNWLLPPRRLNGLTISLPAGSPGSVTLEAQLLDSNDRTPLSAKEAFVVQLKPAGAVTAAVTQNAVAAAIPAIAPKQPQPSASSAFNTQTLNRPAPPASATTDPNFKTQTVMAPPPAAAAPFQATLIQRPAGSDTARRLNPRPEVEDLIREGNKRMREGDILEARQFYQKAVALGDPEAALAMGRSYDPIYFARIDKKNAEPDAAKAFDWYRRAMDAGAAQTAMVRIENLKHFLNE